MGTKVDRLEPLIEDALTRIAALGLSDREVQREAGLPEGFLRHARAGKRRDAAASWAALRAWLATTTAGKGIEPESAPVPGEPVDATSLETEIRAAKTFRRLGALTSRLAADFSAGRLEARVAEVLEKLIARRAKVLAAERSERAVAQVRALEILTPDEARLLALYRAKLAGPALEPGKYCPPPDESRGGPAADLEELVDEFVGEDASHPHRTIKSAPEGAGGEDHVA